MFCDLLLRPRAIGGILSGHEALTPGDPEVKTEAKDRDPNVLLPDGTQLSDRPSVHLFLLRRLRVLFVRALEHSNRPTAFKSPRNLKCIPIHTYTYLYFLV